MANCLNCNSNIGCTCQRIVANDGTSCCANCVGAYNAAHPSTQKVNNNPGAPKTSVSGNTAPQNVSAVYRGPGHQIQK